MDIVDKLELFEARPKWAKGKNIPAKFDPKNLPDFGEDFYKGVGGQRLNISDDELDKILGKKKKKKKKRKK